jgi:hypothetical protein
MSNGTVYLLHFESPYHHARHYLGWTAAESVDARLKRHLAGDGAILLRYVVDAGINVSVVRTWPGGRTAERALKKQHNTPRLCPICNPQPKKGE